WFPNNFLNSDKTILDFRNFDFQQFFQERRVGSTQDDNWSITTHLHSFNHCTYRFTLSKEIARDLFRFWQEQFITFFVEHHQFLSPDLIYFSIDNLTYALSIFLQDSILFKIANSCGKCLLSCQYCSSSKIKHVYLFIYFFSNTIVRVDHSRLRQLYFCIIIFFKTVFYNHSASEDFQVTCLVIYDHIKILVRTIFLSQQGFEYIF